MAPGQDIAIALPATARIPLRVETIRLSFLMELLDPVISNCAKLPRHEEYPLAWASMG